MRDLPVRTKDLKNWLAGLDKCGDCPRCNFRKQVIPGVGNSANPTLFIITGPVREHEDANKYGRKFTDPGAALLKLQLEKLGLKKYEHCYITSVVKCYAPHEPSFHEWNDCSAYITAELQQTNPRNILLLGQEAVTFWWEYTTPMKLSQARGKVWERDRQKIFATDNPDDLDGKDQSAWEKDWDIIGTHLTRIGT